MILIPIVILNGIRNRLVHEADRGYVSQKLVTQLLKELGIQFFAKPRTAVAVCRETDKHGFKWGAT